MISHLALIMDGNRRWAKKRSLLPWLGHRQGVKVVEMAIQYCLDNHISYLSLYTFSLENFGRPQQEVSYLFSLIKDVTKHVTKFVEAGVAITFVGDLAQVPSETRTVCEQIEKDTQQGAKLHCNVLLSYGSRQEICAAAESLKSAKEKITPELFKKYLWTGDIPDPEAVIRTGGVKRLSNFLLFQCSYSEIRFLDCLWPDLTQDLLHETVLDCVAAQKNMGK